MKTNTYKTALKSKYRGNKKQKTKRTKKLNTIEKYRPISTRREIQSNKYANCRKCRPTSAEKYRPWQIFELQVPIFIYFKYLFNDVLHLFFKRIESINFSEIVVSFEIRV